MIEAYKEDKLIKLRVCDTGVGLDPQKDADIFIPFIADQEGKLYTNLDKRLNPEDRYIVGTGSGLGLSIVHEILSARKGAISILPPQDRWKAIIEVSLP